MPRAYNTGHFGFTDNEIVSLRSALEFCVRKSLLAITASLTAFANFMDAFELWFGKLPNGALKNRQIERVVTGVMKMHLVLSYPTQFITFIDMRHQNVRHGIPNSIHRPAPGLSTCYGKSYTEFAEDKYPAYPPTPEGLDVPKHLPTQGMRILVGEHMMHPCQSAQTKVLIIYHELTHKILGTLDKGLGFLGDGTIGTKPIFGEDSVQQMAKDFPEKTLLVADCWANFVIYFGE